MNVTAVMIPGGLKLQTFLNTRLGLPVYSNTRICTLTGKNVNACVSVAAVIMIKGTNINRRISTFDEVGEEEVLLFHSEENSFV